MKFIVEENEYNVDRAEQIIMDGRKQLSIYSSDDIDIEKMDEDIRPIVKNGCSIVSGSDTHQYVGYELETIRKNIGPTDRITITLVKTSEPNA